MVGTPPYPAQTSQAFGLKISPGFGDAISTAIPKTIFTWKNVSHKDAMPSSSRINFGSVPCKLPPSKGEISTLVGRVQIGAEGDAMDDVIFP